jgi:hypothetical protein
MKTKSFDEFIQKLESHLNDHCQFVHERVQTREAFISGAKAVLEIMKNPYVTTCHYPSDTIYHELFENIQ